MQARHDWLQRTLSKLLGSPLVETRVGHAFVHIGELLQFDLTPYFPATTCKELKFETVKRELYCFLNGLTSKEDLHSHGLYIWDANMNKEGRQSIGPIYGHQWRRWGGWHDQIRDAIKELTITKGGSRRALVSAWNPIDILYGGAVVPPCPVLFQLNYVNEVLYMDVYQRSADAFLGLPFDVASFALLTRLFANELQMVGLAISEEKLNYHIGNLHLYKDHEKPALMALANSPSQKPTLACDLTTSNFHYDGAELRGYVENRFIKAKLLV